MNKCNCGKTFGNKGAYIAHSKYCEKGDHEPEKSFKCDGCGKKFSNSGNLERHKCNPKNTKKYDEIKRVKTDNLCEYGCGNKAKWRLTNGKFCCSENFQSCPKIKKKNSQGLKKAYDEGRKSKKGFDGKRHKFTDEDRRKGGESRRYSLDDILDGKYPLYKSRRLKRRILSEDVKEHKCERCGRKQWLGDKIPLELHHINGNSNDHREENLELLCPNCHHKTENFRGRSKNRKHKKVSDERLIEALNNNKNIHQALIEVGLTPKGDNYNRCKKLLNEK